VSKETGAVSLPEWDDIADKIERNEKLNPLEHFVFENTPTGTGFDELFRAELIAAIQYACSPDSEAKR
jgi:hypothetical protein